MTQTKVMVLGLALILSFSQLSLASGHGDVTVRINGGCQAYIGDTNTLEIWITNDAPIIGMSLGFEFTSLVNYVWVKPYGNREPEPHIPIIQEEGDAIGALGSYGLRVIDHIDNQSPDSLLFGGVSDPEPGGGRPFPTHNRSTLCYTLKFFIPAGQAEAASGFCIDNIFFPPGGSWTFDEGYPTKPSYPPTFQGQPNADRGNPTAPPVCFDVVRWISGDANDDGNVDISDAVYLICYIFSGGPAPQPLIAGDANCDGMVDISDAVYLIAYIFSGGQAPCASR